MKRTHPWARFCQGEAQALGRELAGATSWSFRQGSPVVSGRLGPEVGILKASLCGQSLQP